MMGASEKLRFPVWYLHDGNDSPLGVTTPNCVALAIYQREADADAYLASGPIKITVLYKGTLSASDLRRLVSSGTFPGVVIDPIVGRDVEVFTNTEILNRIG